MFGLPDFKSHSKPKPFAKLPLFDHPESVYYLVVIFSTSFGGSAQIDEKLQQKLLQEEEQAMSKFKVKLSQAKHTAKQLKIER